MRNTRREPKLFGKWQQRCGLSPSVLQQLVTQMASAAPTSPGAGHAADVDSECILNDDEIATIDGGRQDVVVSSAPNTAAPQVCWDPFTHYVTCEGWVDSVEILLYCELVILCYIGREDTRVIIIQVIAPGAARQYGLC